MRLDRVIAALLPIASALLVGACSFDLDKWFERDDPAVESARRVSSHARSSA